MSEDTPLSGVKSYLSNRLKGFPQYDWRDNNNHHPKTPLHIWYEEGFDLVSHLEMLFFQCSSSYGNHRWPFGGPARSRRLFNFKCQWEDGCDALVEGLINDVRVGPGEDDWKRLPDAPRFLCFPHLREVATGKKYIPPTADENARSKALWLATERMHKEQPPELLELENGLKVDKFKMMDGNYLKRLAMSASLEVICCYLEPKMKAYSATWYAEKMKSPAYREWRLANQRALEVCEEVVAVQNDKRAVRTDA